MHMNAREYSAINSKRGEFTPDEKEHIRKRLDFLIQMGYIEDGCRYIKNDVEIGGYSGRLDERDSILVIQRNYYDYSGLKEQKRRFMSVMFGVAKITNIELVVYKKGFHNIFDMDRMERFDLFVDYLEKNLDSILSDKGLFFLRKYHK